MLTMKKINVLMSTFNGEKYLQEQIESILNQKGCMTYLTIRDDGSTDNTIFVAEEFVKKYPKRIDLIRGENIGYRKSFLLLLLNATDDADYYAFSDQDDVWMPDKCINAVKEINLHQNDYALYASSVDICDEDLNIIYTNKIPSGKVSLKSIFVRNRLAGCTMLFTKQLRQAALKSLSVAQMSRVVPSHDFFCFSLASTMGEVYVDEKSYILHRRLKSSLTSKEKGLWNRIRTEFVVVYKNKYEKFTMAQILLQIEKNMHCIRKSDNDFLELVVKQRSSLLAKMKLIIDKEFTCGMLMCDLEAYFKILIGNF